MSGHKKTEEMLRVSIPPSLLEENPNNPNEMNDREFDLLVAELDRTGMTDAIFVAPKDTDDLLYFRQLLKDCKKKFDLVWAQMQTDGRKLRIIGGHHRVRAAVFLNWSTVPVTVVIDEEFDQDRQELEMIRHNAIHGDWNSKKFFALYKKHEAKFGADMMAEMFGFADQDMLDKLIEETEKSLPDDMKKKFKEAAAEVKTVDDLAKILNKLITTYGETLPYGFMVFDYGGKESVWLRVSKKTYEALHVIGDQCVHEKRTVDDVVGVVVQLIALGKAPDLMKAAVDQTPVSDTGSPFVGMPTADTIEKIKDVKAAL
jgi:hypothetical protein